MWVDDKESQNCVRTYATFGCGGVLKETTKDWYCYDVDPSRKLELDAGALCCDVDEGEGTSPITADNLANPALKFYGMATSVAAISSSSSDASGARSSVVVRDAVATSTARIVQEL